MELDNPAAAEAGSAAPPDTQWVVFVCSGTCYALELERVAEILTPRPFTRLPGSGPAVAGLIGVRSRIITAYDLGTVLGVQPARSVPDHRVLLAESGGRVRGLVVDEVLAVSALPAIAGDAGDGLVLATTDWDGRAVQALDLERVLERALAPAER